MLGILVGTQDGLLQVVPGEEPTRALEGRPVVALDYRDGMAAAAVAGEGVWVHLDASWRQLARTPTEGWVQVWKGEPRAVRASPGGELYIGADPAALFAVFPGAPGGNELGGLRGALLAEPPSPAAAPTRPRYVAGIAFADSGPESALYVAVAGSGVWSTREDGRGIERFEKRSGGLGTDLNGVWAHPERAGRVYASTGSGFYRSEDGGLTWVQSISGLDRSWAGSLAVVPGTPDVLLLGCARREGGEVGALFRSDNGGVNWKRVMLGNEDTWKLAPLVTRLWDSEDTLFAVAGSGLWGSHDGGRSWVELASGLPPALSLTAAL